MELELEGPKDTKNRKELASTNGLQITKDGAGPVFFSRETESMFILTAHLKGFRRERIKITISEDGSRISISGDKPVQEIVRWRISDKELKIKSFVKVFSIPGGVISNRIHSNFNEDGTILSIYMPKLKEGIQGIEIKQVEEELILAEAESFKASPPSIIAAEQVTKRDRLDALDGKERKDHIGENSSKRPQIQWFKELENITSKETQEIKSPTSPETNKQKSKEEEATKFESGQDEQIGGQECQGQKEEIQGPPFQEDKQTEEEETSKEIKSPTPPETSKQKSKEEATKFELNQDEQSGGQESRGQKEEIQGAPFQEDKQTEKEEKRENLGFVDEGKPKEDCRETEKKEGETGKATTSRRCRLCAPCLLTGSAVVGILIVIAFQLVSKHKKSKKH